MTVLDGALLKFALSELGVEREDEDGQADVELPDRQTIAVDYGTAFELWSAWRNNGVMPYSGGYLEQPRWWRHILHLWSNRYNLAREQAKVEKKLIDDEKREYGEWE